MIFSLRTKWKHVSHRKWHYAQSKISKSSRKLLISISLYPTNNNRSIIIAGALIINHSLYVFGVKKNIARANNKVLRDTNNLEE